MKLTLVSLLTFFSFVSFAQIKFVNGTLDEALALAKKENKPLFVDVYATWCGPCKYMAATAFVDEKVAEFYNANFINLKLDGEKNDGPDVMRKFNLSAYPTLLYFNPDGSLGLKVVGGLDAKQLLNKGREVVNPETSPVFVARKAYLKSAKKQKDLQVYIKVLDENENDSLAYYSEEYFKQFPELDLKNEVELVVFKNAVHDYKHPLSKKFIETPSFREDKTAYLDKMNDYFGYSFKQAKAANNFQMMQETIEYLFPFIESCDVPNLPKMSDFIEKTKAQF